MMAIGWNEKLRQIVITKINYWAVKNLQNLGVGGINIGVRVNVSDINWGS